MTHEHFNDLSPAQLERLALVTEECGEVVQIICKILRHGYHSVHPDNETGPDNRDMLMKELGDLAAVMDILISEDLKASDVSKFRGEKHVNVKQYLHHQ